MVNGIWVVLNVDNVEKSAEFYKALGLKTSVETMELPGARPAPMGTVESGGSGLILWDKHIVPEDAPADTRAWVSGELGKGVLITIGVANAEKVWTNAQKIRAQVESGLEKQPWGGREFTLVDLDGYVINVTDKWPGEPAPKPKAKAKTAAKKVAKKAKNATKKRR